MHMSWYSNVKTSKTNSDTIFVILYMEGQHNKIMYSINQQQTSACLISHVTIRQTDIEGSARRLPYTKQ